MHCDPLLLTQKQNVIKICLSLVLVAHIYNPRYLADRGQEDCSSRPAQAKSENLSQKYPVQKEQVEW
jgi:hypothetical protein